MFLAAFLLLAQPPITVLTPSAAQFERVELAVSTPEKPANPFDPNDSTVDARISLPSGRTIRVPAFWYQDYTRSIQNPGATGAARVEVVTPKGEPGWRVRFGSPESGAHTVSVEWRIRGKSGAAGPATVQIRPGTRANLVPTLTAQENILLPLSLARKKPEKEWFDQVIDTVDLRPRLGHKPSELSGGQQQRVACARALVSRPDIVFADEPTGNLDSTSAAQVLEFLRRSVDDLGQTIVMVSHDPVAASYCDRVVFLADGRIVDELAKPTREEILAHMSDLQSRAMGLAPIGEGF